MSLDVYLNLPGAVVNGGSGIFIRENGQKLQISREEWDRRNPGREPVVASQEPSEEVYSDNITHNLGKMATEAGLYDLLWRPEEKQITKARQLIEPLAEGLDCLKAEPERYKALNPSNGWGTYEGLVAFTEQYLNACKQFPDADVSVWR